MALERVRFLHTSDWHLETPLGGICDVPAELRDDFINAPYRSAERVIEEAIDEAVDFVLLSGNLLPTQTASPYTLEFVLQQFERLHEQGIAIYWAGGDLDDPDLWPTQLALPSNVHTFPVRTVESYQVLRDEEPIAEILGQSKSGRTKLAMSTLAGDNEQLARVVVANGEFTAKQLEVQGVDYWALGGHAEYGRVGKRPLTAFYAGSPQGRTPAELGRHTCNLVELKFGEVDVRRIDTAAICWQHERLHLSSSDALNALETEVRERLQRKTSSVEAALVLLTWEIVGDQAGLLTLSKAERQRLMNSWSVEQGEDRQRTVDIRVAPGQVPEEFWEEDSILGDFLRVVRDLQQHENSKEQLESYLPKGPVRDEILAEIQMTDADDRLRLWQGVADLGVGLLRGEASLQSVSPVESIG